MLPLCAFTLLCTLSFLAPVLSIDCNNTQYPWPYENPNLCCDKCPPGTMASFHLDRFQRFDANRLQNCKCLCFLQVNICLRDVMTTLVELCVNLASVAGTLRSTTRRWAVTFVRSAINVSSFTAFVLGVKYVWDLNCVKILQQKQL